MSCILVNLDISIKVHNHMKLQNVSFIDFVK